MPWSINGTSIATQAKADNPFVQQASERSLAPRAPAARVRSRSAIEGRFPRETKIARLRAMTAILFPRAGVDRRVHGLLGFVLAALSPSVVVLSDVQLLV